MKKILSYGLIVVLLALSLDALAQRVRRSVISSFGSSSQVNGIYISSTAAQPPNAGTISNPAVTLRQGFQQPPLLSPPPPECVNSPKAEFTFEKISKSCGEDYNFVYTGVPQPSTVFNWKFGQDAFIPSSSERNPKGISYSSVGTKFVSLDVITGVCTLSTAIVIQVTKSSFGAFTEGSNLKCFADANGTAKLTILNGTLPYTYQWKNNVSSSALASNLTPGNYGFTVTDAKGCSYSSEVTIVGPDSIGVASKVQMESCNNAKNGAIVLTVTGGKSPFSYKWSTGATTQDISNLAGGLYNVTITDAIGCSRQLDFEVDTACPGFLFKNLITPNGDGVNDVWVITGIENLPDCTVEIFNRWGVLIYSKKSYDNTWGGTNGDGEDLPAGPYYYVLKLNDNIGTVFSGSVAIIR